MLETTRLPSVKLLPMFYHGAHKYEGSLRRNARPALLTGLGARRGEASRLIKNGGGGRGGGGGGGEEEH
eukprot:2578916-Pyramimonas_sp.AAC.1